jgi:hypothetical protein
MEIRALFKYWPLEIQVKERIQIKGVHSNNGSVTCGEWGQLAEGSCLVSGLYVTCGAKSGALTKSAGSTL